MFLPSQKDIDILFQRNKQLYIKLYLLNRNFQTIDELQGELTSGSITIDADSDIRRTANFTFHIKDKSYYADQYSKIWMDKFVELKIGMYYNKTREILWYPLGTYIFNENGFNYNATARSISCSCVDLMGYFTGLRAGTLRGLKTQISYGMIVTGVVRDILKQLGNIRNYIIEPNVNPNYLKIPYDLEFGTASTVYDLLKKVADIYPATEFYFDADRTFIWAYTPTAVNDIVLLDNDILDELVIDDSSANRFSDIKNCIEIWGKDDISARLLLVDKLPSVRNPDYTYKVNPNSPFTVDKIGEIWDVKSSGEYALIYSDELALDRARYELFLSTSSKDSLSLNMMLIPFLEVNKKISYKVKSTGKTNQYITKRISFDISSATMQVDFIRFTPLYSWL